MLGLLRRHGRGRAGLSGLACTLLFLLVAVPATALVRVPAQPAAVSNNPANALAGLPIERATYDRATRCSKAPRPGTTALVAWLSRNAAGGSWGTFRCEKWGKGSASLHAEGRALDWHLDRSKPAEAREARRLILLLLAPDRAGNAQALARRMGIQEIIWDCGYWGAGMASFKKYAACYSESGRARRSVGKTVAHRDHIHFGLTKAGAAKKTSFWTRRAPRPQDQAAPGEARPGGDEDWRDDDEDEASGEDDDGFEDDDGWAEDDATNDPTDPFVTGSDDL